MNSETIAVRSDTAAPNSCVRCKKPLEPNSYRRCDDCRAKMRQYYQKSKLKAKQAAAQLQAIENMQPAFSPKMGSRANERDEGEEEEATSESTSLRKSKNEWILSKLRKRICWPSFSGPIKVVWSIVQSRIENNTEYITASALYEALKMPVQQDHSIFEEDTPSFVSLESIQWEGTAS
ncbi:hypothetical protein BDQ17DRAFT_1409369 [Cyathus striatus]|nr:hypothetical protein BDQ17DRAFT_1409369 [Cyathus striatus]